MNYTIEEIEDKANDLGFDPFLNSHGGWLYAQSHREGYSTAKEEVTLSLDYNPDYNEVCVGVDINANAGDVQVFGTQDFMENVWYIGLDEGNKLVIDKD